MTSRFIKFCCLCGVLWATARPATAQPIGPDFTALSESVLPTTVHIHVERGPLIASGIQQMAWDRLIPSPRRDSKAIKTSTGSGVIVDKSGLVLTNHHVINAAANIQVTLHDQRIFKATVVASDPRTDLAMIQIQGDGPFEPATFDTSGSVKVGQWVVAVGHPFNFPFTVTAGIISALGRRGLAQNEIQDYIQTDVAVNPGSSGGPLFNTRGEVVGINTAIFSPDKENLANAGISFAIPSEMALDIGMQLAKGLPITSSGIGVRTANAINSKIENRPGARITRVIAGSPAETAGLRRGDIIFAVDGRPVSSSSDFKGLVQSRKIGSKLRIDFGRGSKEKSTNVTTIDAGKIGASALNNQATQAIWAGLSLADTTQKNLTERGVSLPQNVVSAALITQVKPDSPGSKAGLLPGDVILEIYDTSIDSVDDLLKTVENQSVVLISFWRGQNRYLAALANRVSPG